MSDVIQQMQISYHPLDDRLLLRIASGQAEFRFWLSRRFVKLMWPHLVHPLFKEGTLAQRTSNPEARRQLLDFNHQRAVSEADFSTPYREQERQTPLGQEPVLAAKGKVTPTPEGRFQVSLHPMTGMGLDLAMDAKLLHSFLKLLADGVAKAEWDLHLTLSDAPEGVIPPPPESPLPPTRLH